VQAKAIRPGNRPDGTPAPGSAAFFLSKPCDVRQSSPTGSGGEDEALAHTSQKTAILLILIGA